ncbi:1-acyl-sn-glycerol-3-phosphate acyltransferase [Compostibacillus humi]|uniref:1-acyl-sn-glycerol-3-phosphate acyltransferase n=1 Tax=Compostibacillus humi TaxID=1245525 RepID=A0A8J2TU78_9BACI|nr:lysophospholipid acyltransferase family protein [Compostibacillus humi]GFZ84299.1 1-acyl-sn-glycerol-3-phosphate acyltransferase [Compostibacillus humi]HLT54763.1 lysophospholipid acyltransferase family protein [Bacillota bacterium]
MVRTISIYVYAGILILGTLYQLFKFKRKITSQSPMVTDEELFSVPNKVAKKIIHITGSEIEVKGQEKLPEGAVLFVSNHQGIFDILAMLGFLGKPVGFIAKKEIEKFPIVRSWMKLIHCVFIDRADRRQSVKAIHQGIQNLKDGHSMVIFPEGTRGQGREIQHFKPGSFNLGIKAKVPIVPVSIDGTYPIFEEKNGRIQSSKIYMTIHDPIFPETYAAMKSAELAACVQKIVEEGMPNAAERNNTDIQDHTEEVHV